LFFYSDLVVLFHHLSLPIRLQDQHFRFFFGCVGAQLSGALFFFFSSGFVTNLTAAPLTAFPQVRSAPRDGLPPLQKSRVTVGKPVFPGKSPCSTEGSPFFTRSPFRGLDWSFLQPVICVLVFCFFPRCNSPSRLQYPVFFLPSKVGDPLIFLFPYLSLRIFSCTVN